MGLTVVISIDKGQCNACNGTGWDNQYEERIHNFFVTQIKLRKPDDFDIDKCQTCNGSGRHIVTKLFK